MILKQLAISSWQFARQDRIEFAAESMRLGREFREKARIKKIRVHSALIRGSQPQLAPGMVQKRSKIGEKCSKLDAFLSSILDNWRTLKAAIGSNWQLAKQQLATSNWQSTARRNLRLAKPRNQKLAASG